MVFSNSPIAIAIAITHVVNNERKNMFMCESLLCCSVSIKQLSPHIYLPALDVVSVPTLASVQYSTAAGWVLASVWPQKL